MFKPPSLAGSSNAGRSALRCLATGLMLCAAACSTPQAPNEQMRSAAAVVSQAAGSGGNEFAPQEMQSARNKLERANAAISDKDYPKALALSREAQVDARLAEAKAESSKARLGAEAAQESNRVLREEIQRKTP